MGQPNNSSFYGNNLINDDNGLFIFKLDKSSFKGPNTRIIIRK